jgi:hypothetical protein
LQDVTTNDAGRYRVVVRNAAGVVTSQDATLTVQRVRIIAALEIAGPVGSQYRIDCTTNLGNPADWATCTNLVLSSSPCLWIDQDSLNHPHRFYRAILVR